MHALSRRIDLDVILPDDVASAQGDPIAALAAYRAGLEIRKRLAKLDPTNKQWQDDLSRIQQRIAAVESLGTGRDSPTADAPS